MNLMDLDLYLDIEICGTQFVKIMGSLWQGMLTLSSPLQHSGLFSTIRNIYLSIFRFFRNKVMELLREMDPQGTEKRKRNRLQRRVYRNKGPNYVWHVDGYDKLRPYGFEIHGCIDGYALLFYDSEITKLCQKTPRFAFRKRFCCVCRVNIADGLCSQAVLKCNCVVN